MALPITDAIEVDPEALFDEFVAYMQSRDPEWEPADGSPDVWMAEGFAQISAQVAEQATDVLTSIFRWYGANIAGVPPIDAVAATSTITITGTAGTVVAAGYGLALTDAAGELVGFTTSEDATLTAGTAAGVPIVANVAGSAGNDLTGTVTQVDSLAAVTGLSLDATTVGGSDAEEDEDYIPRLIAEEQTRSVAPILGRDFAQLSKRVLEVDRTAYLDGYNTADGTSNNALMVTLVPVKEDGSDVSPAGKTAIVTQFSEDGTTPALVGFVVNVVNPHRTAVAVHFTAVASDGWDPVVVKASGEQAVADFLDPANFGQPLAGDNRLFEPDTKVRWGQLHSVLYNVPGVRSVTAVTLGLQGGALAAADYTLPVTTAEPIGLTSAGADIVGTVT